MEKLQIRFDKLLRETTSTFHRYMYDKINWNARMVCLLGPRGIGKTTMVLQYIKENLPRQETLYVVAEDLYFSTHTLVDLADEFARTGGTVGKSFLVNDVPYPSIYAGYLIRTRYSNMLSAQYMKYFMECELYWEQLRNGTIATAQPNCNGKTLAKMILPIPPYNEQIRITEKLNQVLKQVPQK